MLLFRVNNEVSGCANVLVYAIVRVVPKLSVSFPMIVIAHGFCQSVSGEKDVGERKRRWKVDAARDMSSGLSECFK